MLYPNWTASHHDNTMPSKRKSLADRVWEFRPLPWFFTGQVLRYNGGRWTEDDGEYDLCFIGGAAYMTLYEHVESYPCAVGVDIGRRNILCSWRSEALEVSPGHKHGFCWHYALIKGTTDWGEPVDDPYSKQERAFREGMDLESKMRGCANGRSVEFHADSLEIAAGLVRDAKTKKVFQWPKGMKCMFSPCPATPYSAIKLAQQTYAKKKAAWDEIAIERSIARLDGQEVKPRLP